MATQVTHDIRVSVKSYFSEEQSDPKAGRFMFVYRVRIENHSGRMVRLLSRRWHIMDSLSAPRQVEGKGVVGLTPTLDPGELFTYSSYCDLRSGFGRMHGTFTLCHMDDNGEFEVIIPSFELLYPFAAN